MKKLADIITQFSTFLLDASGVIYSDYGAFEGTPEAIQKMQALGQVFVVTNNSFNSPHTISKRLLAQNINIATSNIISSGFGLYYDTEIKNLTKNKTAYVYGSEDSHYYVKKAQASSITTNIQEAEVIIMTASYKGDNKDELAIIQNELKSRPKLPIICCNPDKVVMSKRGIKPVIGHFAERLEILNKATVHWIGKPYTNFNLIVQKVLNDNNIELNENTCFFDDNIENVQNMSRDINISGCWVKETGIFKENPIDPLTQQFGHPSHIIDQLSL